MRVEGGKPSTRSANRRGEPARAATASNCRQHRDRRPAATCRAGVMALCGRRHLLPATRWRAGISVWGLMPDVAGRRPCIRLRHRRLGQRAVNDDTARQRFMIPLVLDNGYHRIECRALLRPRGRGSLGRPVRCSSGSRHCAPPVGAAKISSFTGGSVMSTAAERQQTKPAIQLRLANSRGRPRTGRRCLRTFFSESRYQPVLAIQPGGGERVSAARHRQRVFAAHRRRA